MSDDLLQRLRSIQRPDFSDAVGSTCNEAADRIEALSSIGEEYSGRIEALTAALRKIVDWGNDHWGFPDIDVTMMEIARLALEEKP